MKSEYTGFFYLFYTLTKWSHAFMIARWKLKVLTNLENYGHANTTKTVMEKSRKSLKRAKGKENKAPVMISNLKS